MKILLIEDDAEIASYLARGLRQAGHVVDVAATGSDGLHLATLPGYDVLVVDRLLPELDGLALVRTLRTSGMKTPVLFLTALGRVDQRVEGLEAGGDDYLVKPFAFTEFLARVTTLARRPPLSDTAVELNLGSLVLHRLRRSITFNGQPIDLQPREFALLEVLMLHKGEIVTKTMLLAKVWDFHFDPRTNIVETHISRLRTKLGRARGMIQTARGSGYVARERV